MAGANFFFAGCCGNEKRLYICTVETVRQLKTTTMNLSKQKQDKLREAFRCIVSLAGATPKDNKTECGCYSHIGFIPDPQTIEETRRGIKLYLETWVIPLMEESLDFSSELVADEMLMSYHEREASRVANRIKSHK